MDPDTTPEPEETTIPVSETVAPPDAPSSEKSSSEKSPVVHARKTPPVKKKRPSVRKSAPAKKRTAVRRQPGETLVDWVRNGDFGDLDDYIESLRPRTGFSNADSIRMNYEKGLYPYPERINLREYERTKIQLQAELLKAQHWVRETGQRLVALFEGTRRCWQRRHH